METSLGTFKCEKNVYSFPKKNLNDFESHTNLLVGIFMMGKLKKNSSKLIFYIFLYTFSLSYISIPIRKHKDKILISLKNSAAHV